MNHVGVVSHARLPELPSKLKRYALFFDQIQIVGLGPDNLGKMARFVSPECIAELEYLYSAGVLAEGKFRTRPLKGVDAESSGKIIDNVLEFLMAQQQLGRVNDLTSLMSVLMEEITSAQEKGEDTQQLVNDYNSLVGPAAESLLRGMYTLPLSARQVALDLQVFENVQAVCIEELDYRSAGDTPNRSADADAIYQIAIEGLPVLEESAWQDIADFKASPEAKQRLRALHIWVSDLAKAKLSYSEARDKIDYLKQEYIDAMTRAKVKYRIGLLRCFVVAAPAFIESFVKLKFKEMAEAPFKIFEERAELLKAEREAPGRELSYTIKADEALR